MALTDIRNVLGQEAVIADQDWLSLNPDLVTSDLALLELTLAKTASTYLELEDSLGLASDEPFAGCEMEWAISERFRVYDLLSEATLRLIDQTQTKEQRQRAVQTGKRILRIVGLREDIHAAIMRLYIAIGLPSQAIAQYEELENALSEQWGESPSAETIAVLNSIPSPNETAIQKRTSSIPRNKRGLIGRDELVASILELLSRTQAPPVLTLGGPGGSGKTSLAIAIGHQFHETTSLPVWFVALAKARDESEMLREIAKTLGLDPGVSDQSHSFIAHHLASTAGLLILDNFEQLSRECAAWVGRLALCTSTLKILATSRSALRVDGEQLVYVPTFKVPSRVSTLDEARSNEAVQLFALEAQSVNPRFIVSASNVQSVIELCRRLDGLPLAIELAAARMASQTPAQALADLHHSALKLETSIVRAEDRHQSLWETISWSFDLLSADSQEAFLRCSLYLGRFGRDAIAAQVDESKADLVIDELVRASILNLDSEGEEPSFWLLETMREFARQRLSGQPFEVAAKRQYLRYWTSWAGSHRTNQNLRTADLLNILLESSSEVISAVEIGLAFDDLLEETARLLTCMTSLIHLPVFMSQISDLSMHVLKTVRGKVPADLIVDVCDLVAITLMNQPRADDCLAIIDEAITHCGDNRQKLSRMQYRKAHCLARHRRYEESFPLYELALADSDSQSEIFRARVELSYGKTLRSGGTGEGALEYLQRALTVARKGDTPIFLSHCLDTVAFEFALERRFDDAHELIDEAISIVERLHSFTYVNIFLVTKGRIHQLEGEHVNAYRCLDKAARNDISLDTGYDPKRASDAFSASIRSLGAPEVAAKFLGKGEIPGNAHADTLTTFEENAVAHERLLLTQTLGETKLERFVHQGKHMNWEDLLDQGSKVCDGFVTAQILS